MLDDSNATPERQNQPRSRRETPAGIDIVALCRSLPADGRLSNDDVDTLKDWASRYHDIVLPSQEYISIVIQKAIAERVITADERDSVYRVVEPVLPVQLRKRPHEQRRVAEIQKALEEGRDDATLSFDFLLAGVHLEGHWQTIKARVRVGDVVQLVQHKALRSRDRRVRVVLSTGECIGFVPDEDALPIAPELARGARIEGTVKKILAGGQYPIPVVGGKFLCSASTLDGELSEPSAQEPSPEVRSRFKTIVLIACLTGALLLASLVVWR